MSDEKDARWIVGYFDGRENILENAFLYDSRENAMKEFAFDPEMDNDCGGSKTVFLAKIVKRQEIQRINKMVVTTVDIEKNKVCSLVEYSVTDEGIVSEDLKDE